MSPRNTAANKACPLGNPLPFSVANTWTKADVGRGWLTRALMGESSKLLNPAARTKPPSNLPKQSQTTMPLATTSTAARQPPVTYETHSINERNNSLSMDCTRSVRYRSPGKRSSHRAQSEIAMARIARTPMANSSLRLKFLFNVFPAFRTGMTSQLL